MSSSGSMQCSTLSLSVLLPRVQPFQSLVSRMCACLQHKLMLAAGEYELPFKKIS